MAEFGEALRRTYDIDDAAEEKIMEIYQAFGGVEDSSIDFVDAIEKLRVLGWMHRDDIVDEYAGFLMPCTECGGIKYDHKDCCANVGKKRLPTVNDVLTGKAVHNGR